MNREFTRDQVTHILNKLRSLGYLSFLGNICHKSSTNTKILCPFHNDKKPSLSIDLNRGVWKCFSCGKKGNIQTMCKQLAHVPAQEFLGLSVFDFITPTYIPKPKNPVTFSPIEILGFTFPALDVKISKDYLKKRKILDTLVLKMNMQYAPDCHINGQAIRERLLIPMVNDKNEIINIECRSLDPKTNPPKVLYPRNVPKPIYDDHNLDRTKPLYLVEGLMDLARLREDPMFSNSTATMGTGLSDYQRTIFEQFDQLILIPDNDTAGWTFAKLLKTIFKDKFSILRIKDENIKDVGDIPIPIPEYNRQGGFVSWKVFSF